MEAKKMPSLASGAEIVETAREGVWIKHAAGWTPTTTQEGDVLHQVRECELLPNANFAPA